MCARPTCGRTSPSWEPASETHAAAIDFIERVQSEEGIDCDFARIDGFLFTERGGLASLGHLDYNFGTLGEESASDRLAGKPIGIPCNYFPDDDLERLRVNAWRHPDGLTRPRPFRPKGPGPG